MAMGETITTIQTSFHVKSAQKQKTKQKHDLHGNLVLTLSRSRHSPIVSFSVISCMASGLESVDFLPNLGLPVSLHT